MSQFKVALSNRGQIVIPAEIRRKFESNEFIIFFDEGKIVLSPSIPDDRMKSLVDKLKQMNKKYDKDSNRKISVLEEIEKEGG